MFPENASKRVASKKYSTRAEPFSEQMKNGIV
jgi:hypothetical protein